MIELLTVIAIIAILAAIIFPVIATLREQTRQSNTLASYHALYVAARTYHDDEGRFPPTLFGYAEISDGSLKPPYRPATQGDNLSDVVPMDQARNAFRVAQPVVRVYHAGLYREYLKDLPNFLNGDNLETNKRLVTEVYYPQDLPNIGGQKVVWRAQIKDVQGNIVDPGDPDIPDISWSGRPKLFYIMDSVDIGPVLKADGTVDRGPDGKPTRYELHYALDWTHKIGRDLDRGDDGLPVSNQLKYRNPQSDRTVITWSTHHVATAGSPNVTVLLTSGTARKISAKDAYKQLPLKYRP